MRRRRLKAPEDLGPDWMYWPGEVAFGLDQIVPASQVQAVCEERMRIFDELPREVRDRINEQGWGK